MKVTNVKIRKMFSSEPLKAVCSVTLEDFIAIHDIKIVSANGKIIVAMPSRKRSGGDYSDIVHPINADARMELEKAILDEYQRMQSEENIKI